MLKQANELVIYWYIRGVGKEKIAKVLKLEDILILKNDEWKEVAESLLHRHGRTLLRFSLSAERCHIVPLIIMQADE